MSECVVRMEMPVGCIWRDDKGQVKRCPMYYEDEMRCQGKDGKKAPWYDGKRPDWCPIICSLPEGHGDLIDRDSMVDEWVDEKIDNPYADYEADDVIYDLKKRTVIVPKDKAHEP